jgi:zinc transporter ZupT
MNSLIIILTIATFISTLLGGFVILKFRKSLPFFFAFAAGALMAVSFLDLLPETLEISNSINFPLRYSMLIILASFFFYSFLDKYFLTHHVDECCSEHGHVLGPIGGGSLILHSFIDGISIGTAFLVNPSVGLVVALAVISHDFTDGINTVTVMLKNKQKTKNAIIFLLMDALAPVLGVILMTFLNLPAVYLVVFLSIFIGEFIYLGASNLLPESKEHPSKLTLLAMAIGIILIAILTALI